MNSGGDYLMAKIEVLEERIEALEQAADGMGE